MAYLASNIKAVEYDEIEKRLGWLQAATRAARIGEEYQAAAQANQEALNMLNSVTVRRKGGDTDEQWAAERVAALDAHTVAAARLAQVSSDYTLARNTEYNAWREVYDRLVVDIGSTLVRALTDSMDEATRKLVIAQAKRQGIWQRDTTDPDDLPFG